jgi:hypothetical protein
MQYARETWLEERSSWRAIIQLNLIRSIVTLLDFLGDALSGPTFDSPSALGMLLTEKHRLLRLRLAPLRGVQQDLQRRLGAAAVEETYNPWSGWCAPAALRVRRALSRWVAQRARAIPRTSAGGTGERVPPRRGCARLPKSLRSSSAVRRT